MGKMKDKNDEKTAFPSSAQCQRSFQCIDFGK